MRYSTLELLGVAGVSAATYRQWLARGHLALSSNHPGTGRRHQHTARDVLQVACIAELARLGVPPHRGGVIWKVAVAPSLLPPLQNLVVLLAPRADDSDHVARIVRHGDWGLDCPDAPAAFVVLRVASLARRVTAQLAALRGTIH